MHRSAAEGRFGEAEPAGRASVCARARTLGVNMLSENVFKEMPTLADKSSDFGFSSGIQVYSWTQRATIQWPKRANSNLGFFTSRAATAKE